MSFGFGRTLWVSRKEYTHVKESALSTDRGKLSQSERKRKAKEIIAASGADTPD